MSASAAAAAGRRPLAEASITAMLEAHGVPYTLHRHADVRTIAEAHARVPHLTAGLLKTVVFELSPSDRRILVAVPCHAQVDYRGVAGALGCARRALRLVPPARVEAELGFAIGGVGPFALTAACEVLVDAAVASATRVRVGGGGPGRTLELLAGDLLRLPRTRRAAVARSAPAEESR